MAEKLCTLRTQGGGGGAKQTETVLWTNPSPNANFPQTTVTLSDSMNNYTYLGLEFKYTTNSSDTMTYYMKVEDFSKQATTSAGSMQVRFGGVGNITMSRYVVKTSDTSITIGNGAQVAGTSTSSTIGIPLYIYGIKVALPPSVGDVKTGTFTSPTSGNTTTITCGFEPKKIYLTMYTSSSNFYVVGYDSVMDSAHQIVGWSQSSSSKDASTYAFPNSSNNGVLVSISSTGFVYKGGTTTASKTIYYTVIG